MVKLTTTLKGVELLAPEYFCDDRGGFVELVNMSRMSEYFPNGVRQISQSFSHRDVVRGLHFQIGMAKMMRVLRGSIWLTNVDIDPSSSSFGQHFDTILTEDNQRVCFATDFIARGFCALEENTIVEYYHSDTYKETSARNHQLAFTIAWNDPDLKLCWPTSHPILSEKDKKGWSLQEWRDYYLTMSMDM